MLVISSVIQGLKGILNRYFLPLFVFLILLHLMVIFFNLLPGEGPDGQAYLEKGVRFARGGDILGKEIFGVRSFRPPLWILIIAAIFYLVGENPIFISLFLLAISCISAYLTYRLGKRLWGPAVGQLGSLLFLASFMTFKFVNNHQYELLLAFLILLTFTFLFESKTKWMNILSGGISWGLAGLCSPKVLIFSLIFFVLFYQKEQLRKSIQRLLTFGIFTFLMILPWTVRNYFSSGEFILISSNGGINFYIGNNPGVTSGNFITSKEFSFPFEYEESFAYYKEGFKYIVAHPIKTLRNMGIKLFHLWNPHYADQLMVFPFFLYGIFWILKNLRSQSVEIKMIIFFLGVFSFIHMLYLSGFRFAIPIHPYIYLMAALGLLSGVKQHFKVASGISS